MGDYDHGVASLLHITQTAASLFADVESLKKFNNEQLKFMEKTLEESKLIINSLESEKKDAQKQIIELEAKVELCFSEKSTIFAENKRLEIAIDDLQIQLNEICVKNKELQDVVAESRSQLADASSKLESALIDCDNKITENNKLKSDLKELKIQENNAAQEISKVKKEIYLTEELNNQLQKDAQQLQESNINLEKEILQAQESNNQLEKEVKKEKELTAYNAKQNELVSHELINTKKNFNKVLVQLQNVQKDLEKYILLSRGQDKLIKEQEDFYLRAKVLLLKTFRKENAVINLDKDM